MPRFGGIPVEQEEKKTSGPRFGGTPTDPVDQAIQESFDRIDSDVPSAADIRQAEIGEQAKSPVEHQNLLAKAFNIPLEFMAGVNRGAANLADFVSTDQVNAILDLAGSDKRITSVNELLSPATQGGFMEEGLGRDIVQSAGEVIPAAVTGGGMMRKAAASVPATVGPGSLTQNIVRQMGSSTPAMDVAYGAASGTGAEIGEEIGGEPGRVIGAIAGPMALGATQSVLQGTKSALPPKATTSPKGAESYRQAAPQAIDDAQRATGIELLPAQKSLDPKNLRAQRFLPELSPTAQKAATVLNKQNQQASKAVDDFIAAIAPDDAVVRGPEKFRSAAQNAVKAADELRQARTSPIYQEAFDDAVKNNIEVNVTPVRATASRIAEKFPEKGQIAGKMRKILGLLKGKPSKEVIPPPQGQAGAISPKAAKPQIIEREIPPSLEKLHNVKLEIDEMLNARGEKSLGRTTKAQLMKVKTVLLREMEKASKKYIEANEKFQTESAPYNRLRDSIVGKISDLDDTQLKNVSRRIFDPAETNPTVVRSAKRVIDDVDPDAWDLLLRGEIERRIGSIKPGIGTSTENIPSKLKNAIFGSGKSRDALLSGMNPQQRRNAELLETALTRASLGRPGGSETAGRGEFLKEMGRGGVIRTIKNWLRSPVDEAVGVGDDALFDRRTKALADALFDPAWAPEAEQALKDPSGKSLGFLLYQISEQNERTDETREQ